MDPDTIRESRRQEELERLGGAEGIDSLPGVQALKEWDAAQKEQKRLERQQQEAERQEALRAQAAETMNATKFRMRERYIKAGGNPEEFETMAWPNLKQQLLEERVLAEPGDHYNAIGNF
jgi:hypothetical protein